MALQLKKKEFSVGTKWVDFDKETKIQLVGIDSPEYQVALERMRRRLQRNDAQFEEGQIGVVAGEKSEHQNHCLLISQFLIKGWEGVLDEDGNKLAFSAESAATLLEGNVGFFLFVLREAAAFSAESRTELSETLGKPSTATNGKASGRAKTASA